MEWKYYSKQGKKIYLPHLFPVLSASAARGVMAVENPIPKDMAMNTKLFPKETAANSAVPNWPTMILSIN